MKKLFLLFILSNMMLNSQTNEQDKVQSAVEIFFDGFHNKDSILIKSVVHKSFSLNSAS
ncbi:MAG: 3-methyl-2-oxobutanoate hydroxymethyltransferase, partial [Flavobacteriaceae bacterium]|nr:3-methyl-2-oxobutanoate hydroxymethyltransferase [Flavobacteriaceae bacterium]